MALLLVVYLVLALQRAVLLIVTGQPVGIAMGVALLVLPVIAGWAIGRELLFGARTEKLVRILEAEGGLPVEDLPTRASGRPLRDAADAQFPEYKAEVEAAPGSWRAWFRLGLAYDASGDRRRARAALRQAIRLYRDDEKRAR
ncbi:tetratricopeptide repeat protein [Leifsonia sp. AG29]|uniref:tetratricopeptide repeat protein n=1 Tax=Leifsonia sp. AG29 TaxID=2598860 RepID=UPI00131D724F|nr:tetratricopeptide repeat protein [Leifsonia sp. AG29]